MSQLLYLKVGDRVQHIRYSSWGIGQVVEEKHSMLLGGYCFVKILFEDGHERTFINDLNDQSCCYYSGLILT